MYRIIGADGKTYGPITVEQLKQWINEGRANAQTQTFVEGATEWKPLGTLPEFTNHFAPPVPPVIGPPGPGPVGAGHPAKTNSFAMAGMIFGILSFVCCFKFLFGSLGLIFSLIGLAQINENPQWYQGRGIAITGVILSAVGLILGIAMLIFGLAMGHYHMMWNFRRF
jgi:Domain of unknown function (DUF4190)/GYF domain 2